MKQVHEAYLDRGLLIVAVNSQEDPGRVVDWAQQRDLPFRVLLDRDGQVAAAYHVNSIPRVFLVARDGRFVGQVAGALDAGWLSPAGRAVLDALVTQ